MTMRPQMRRLVTSILAVTACAALGASALAQGPGGPGGAGGRGGGGRQGRGGMRGMGMGRPMTAVALPIEVMEKGLKLTPAQKGKVDGIQRAFGASAQGMFPRPAPGAPPDMAKMQAAIGKLQAAASQASKKIEGVLTGAQKPALAKLLADANDFRAAGLPVQAVTELKLTPPQRKGIASIATKARAATAELMPKPGGDMRSAFGAMREARDKSRAQAMALLTAPQKATVEKLTPRRGGFGGPGGGGFGGRGGAGGQVRPGGAGGRRAPGR